MSAVPKLPKFWMVYGIGQGAPTQRHETKERAQNEARRLASVAPGKTFVVLAAVDAFHAEEPVVSTVRVVKASASETFVGGVRSPRSRFPADDIPF